MVQSATAISQFSADVIRGLTATPKYLPSKYFYDANGDRLFQMIMALPEYYVTRAEYEIFKFQSPKIVQALEGAGELNLIELGAGDGLKTRLLLKELVSRNKQFTYFPVDISANVLNHLQEGLGREFGDKVRVKPLTGDYFEALAASGLRDAKSRLILFLGNTIGNFQPREASDFLGRLSQQMKPGDKLLIGYDLKKHPQTVLNAYNDKQGVTREFNLNLLRRINQELGANFNLGQFTHFPVYDPVQGAARSYLVSLQEQEVYISAARQRIYFRPYETIFTEISQKFDGMMIREFGARHHLKILNSFTDSRNLFADVLYERL